MCNKYLLKDKLVDMNRDNTCLRNLINKAGSHMEAEDWEKRLKHTHTEQQVVVRGGKREKQGRGKEIWTHCLEESGRSFTKESVIRHFQKEELHFALLIF